MGRKRVELGEQPGALMLSVARYVARQAVDFAEAKLLAVLTLLSWRRRRELARRARERRREEGRWFTAAELTIISALASLIVPSGEEGPGAREAGVAEGLDRLVARSQSRQSFYARGLLACDGWARRQHGRAFADLTADEQLALLRWVDRMSVGGAGAGSVIGKIAHRAAVLYKTWRCPFLELFPHLVRDVRAAFYTSLVCWEWLGYDGPPMPLGYPDLRERGARR